MSDDVTRIIPSEMYLALTDCEENAVGHVAITFYVISFVATARSASTVKSAAAAAVAAAAATAAAAVVKAAAAAAAVRQIQR